MEQRPMNVLIVGQLPPPVHGSNVMTELFMQSMEKIVQKVTIIEKKFSKQQEEVGTLTLLKVTKVPGLILKFLWQLIKNKPDVCFYFISVSSFSLVFDALLIALIRLFGVQYILYCHGKGFRELELRAGSHMRYVAKFVLTGALGGLVLGEKLKHDVNHYLPDRRLFILPNAIPNSAPPQKEPGTSRHVQILYLSNLIPSKGAMEFVKMAGMVRRAIPDVKFILAGNFRDNIFLRQIHDCIDQEKLRDCMDIPGAIYGQDKEKLFRKSDLFVFPTYYKYETFGLVNLEAMRSSLPIISTPEGAIPEVVCDGITGFIVDPHDIALMSDRVLKLVEDLELRIAMGKAGRRRFEQYYTIEAYEAKLKEAIQFFSLLLQEKRYTACE